MSTLQRPKPSELAEAFAARLGETDIKPRKQIKYVIDRWGPKFVEQYVQKAERLHEQGGLPRFDGSPRTKGGIFFFLVRRIMQRSDPVGAVGIFGPRPQRLPRKRADQLAKAAANGQVAGGATTVALVRTESASAEEKSRDENITELRPRGETGSEAVVAVPASRLASGNSPSTGARSAQSASGRQRPAPNAVVSSSRHEAKSKSKAARKALPAPSTYFDPEFVRR